MIDTKVYNNIITYLRRANTGLVAVSKTKTVGDILELYRHGQRLFGENYVQEVTGKYEQLPKDIQWHFIGHLQSNKVKYIAPFIDTIQSIDSLKLLKEIDKQAAKNNRTIKCLLQLHVAKEETKFGLSFDEARHILFDRDLKTLQHTQITGLMGMASLTDDEAEIRSEFHLIKSFFDEMRNKLALPFTTLSMGMSSDYKIAIEEGSNLVRIGSLIFGERK